LVCDEPISALDVSIKSQIANLLKDLQSAFGISVLFIAHDLAAVRFSCDRILVLYLGRVMEIASRTALFETPRHPYARALLQSVPVADPALARACRAFARRDSLAARAAVRLCVPHALPHLRNRAVPGKCRDCVAWVLPSSPATAPKNSPDEFRADRDQRQPVR
jgi:peptide/nickel transport system ATP-binding protein